MGENKTEVKNSKDGLALILGGIFVLGLVFATYTYFNKSSETLDKGNLTSEESSAVDKLKDIIASKTERNSNDKTEVMGAETENKSTEQTTQWVATNYNNGDIKAGSYTVKKGDTLWEIAEAVYGNGADWTKILDANKGSIGFLPNGSQALIVTGQSLVLP